jgi:hypothetical protein
MWRGFTVLQNCSRLVPVTDRLWNWILSDPSKTRHWLIAFVLCLFCPISVGPAWGQVGTEEKRPIVAAGFGYQIGAVSAIAVKVYDAKSGEVLSDEVYELAVKESDGVRSSRGPRIFAGGVGLGATDLSNFVLRVYDANTGVFQWEGRLNLVQPEGKAGGRAVSTALLRRAIVTRVHIIEATTEQPVFLLRAMDAATGMLVWEDEFTTIRTRIPQAHRIVDQTIHSDSLQPTSAHTFNFNFQIRMYDLTGRNVLWEDQLSQVASDERPEQSHRDQADRLPAWPYVPQRESAVGSI